MNRLAALGCSVLLGCGMAWAQEQSSGTVNTLSVDPEQNQKLSGQMGTTTGQPNDVTRGEDRHEQMGNPSNKQISGQSSNPSQTKQQKSKQSAGGSGSAKTSSGSPSANQKSASTNSGKAPRRNDNRDHSGPQ